LYAQKVQAEQARPRAVRGETTISSYGGRVVVSVRIPEQLLERGAFMTSFVGQDAGSTAIEYLANLSDVLQRIPREPLARSVAVLLDARSSGRRVYVFGNGGSAATASHFVCDLVKTAQVPGFRPFRASSLTDNTALMTAWANDHAYSDTFPRMIEAFVEPGDVVIGISASGNSPNVVEGLRTARQLDAHTIAFLGFDGGAALSIAEIAVHVPSHHYGLAEDAHSAIGHAITAAVRSALTEEQNSHVIRLLGDVAAAAESRAQS
jgi:D-sedoheptulose 7-phosphate isomerase